MSKSEYEKVLAGEEYDFWDDQVNSHFLRGLDKCKEFNAIDPHDDPAVKAAIYDLVGSSGKSVNILPDFHCDYGLNIHMGERVTINKNCSILDVAPVYLGNHVMIGPNTTIITVNHPMSPKGRRNHLGIAKPVYIGNDVWIGAGSIILPGVHIGNNVVIGAGSVVTKDIPDNSFAAGNPARVIREIENDLSPEEQESFQLD